MPRLVGPRCWLARARLYSAVAVVVVAAAAVGRAAVPEEIDCGPASQPRPPHQPPPRQQQPLPPPPQPPPHHHHHHYPHLTHTHTHSYIILGIIAGFVVVAALVVVVLFKKNGAITKQGFQEFMAETKDRVTALLGGAYLVWQGVRGVWHGVRVCVWECAWMLCSRALFPRWCVAHARHSTPPRRGCVRRPTAHPPSPPPPPPPLLSLIN